MSDLDIDTGRRRSASPPTDTVPVHVHQKHHGPSASATSTSHGPDPLLLREQGLGRTLTFPLSGGAQYTEGEVSVSEDGPSGETSAFRSVGHFSTGSYPVASASGDTRQQPNMYHPPGQRLQGSTGHFSAPVQPQVDPAWLYFNQMAAMGYVQNPQLPAVVHPSMQPMSGMAGVGYAPFFHGQAQPGFFQRPMGCPESSNPHGVGSRSEPAHARSRPSRRGSVHSGSPSPSLSSSRRLQVSPSSRRGLVCSGSSSPPAPSSSSRRRLGDSSSVRGGRARSNSPSPLAQDATRKRGRRATPARAESLSPSPRRNFVREARRGRSSSSSSSSSSSQSDEEEEKTASRIQEDAPDNKESFSFARALSIVAELRPDLVTSSEGGPKKALSSGEKIFSKNDQATGNIVLKQSDLLCSTLINLQQELRGANNDPPSSTEVADLLQGAMKTGDLFSTPSSLHKRPLLAKGILPSKRLTPSRSDLSCRKSGKNSNSFKPLLKEKSLTSMEETALRGLEALSIVDSVLGVVMGSREGSPLSNLYPRRPTEDEISDLLLLTCKGVSLATNCLARGYMNAVLIKRDSFLSEASKLPDVSDRSALRSLPIAPPALLGPQVKLTVKRCEKDDFEESVKDCLKSKARSESRQSPKRRRTDFKPPQSKKSGGDSFANSYSKKSFGKKNQPSNQGKPKPKGSANPQ